MTHDQISEWWESVFKEEWDDSLWSFGFSDIRRRDDYPADRMALLAETRWKNNVRSASPARMWDPEWQASGFSGALTDRRSLALIRSRMPRMLAQWMRKQARKAGVS